MLDLMCGSVMYGVTRTLNATSNINRPTINSGLGGLLILVLSDVFFCNLEFTKLIYVHVCSNVFSCF